MIRAPPPRCGRHGPQYPPALHLHARHLPVLRLRSGLRRSPDTRQAPRRRPWAFFPIPRRHENAPEPIPAPTGSGRPRSGGRRGAQDAVGRPRSTTRLPANGGSRGGERDDVRDLLRRGEEVVGGWPGQASWPGVRNASVFETRADGVRGSLGAAPRPGGAPAPHRGLRRPRRSPRSRARRLDTRQSAPSPTAGLLRRTRRQVVPSTRRRGSRSSRCSVGLNGACAALSTSTSRPPNALSTPPISASTSPSRRRRPTNLARRPRRGGDQRPPPPSTPRGRAVDGEVGAVARQRLRDRAPDATRAPVTRRDLPRVRRHSPWSTRPGLRRRVSPRPGRRRGGGKIALSGIAFTPRRGERIPRPPAPRQGSVGM